MPDEFEFDLFLSHSTKDKTVVRELAFQLKSDGVKVWFDEWEIKPGDSIPAKIEDGLERSRVLVLCMSAQAFGSDWPQLESHTFRFKDPLNHARRFIPLRLDDVPIKGSLAQFLYINWQPKERELEYPKLLVACRPDGRWPLPDRTRPTGPESAFADSREHDLRIRISPTRKGRRQLAQIQLLNAGERPILIDEWYVEWADTSASMSRKCERGSLPIRLQDHERAVLLIDISDKPAGELKAIGVIDAERRLWPTESIELQRFVHLAKLHAPPVIEQPKEEVGEPGEVSILVSVAGDAREVFLNVTFSNKGTKELVPRAARVEWKYEPPRELPQAPGEPQVAEAGGSISLDFDRSQKVVSPNSDVVFFLRLRDPLAQPIVSVLADDVPDENLRVTVDVSHWRWEAKSDEVPGAIREFAREVLREQEQERAS